MIFVEGLTKRYGPNIALDNISFNVPKGKIVGFLGANGAGKTTTMDIICGCMGPDHGVVKIGDYDISSEPKKAKAQIGYLPDEPPIYQDMTVTEFVTFAGQLRGLKGAELKKRVNETMDRLSIQEVKHRLIGKLSKGFKQRVGLAQAIVHSPAVLVLDEPTEGLDPNQIVQIRDLIKDLAGEHTILLSSHILSEVQNTCEEILIIHKGKIVKKGTYSEITAATSGDKVYQLRTRSLAQPLISKLEVVSGVSRVSSLDPHLLEIIMAGEMETIDPILKVALDSGAGIQECLAIRQNLEEVFVKLTH